MAGTLRRVASVFVVVAGLTYGCGGRSSTPGTAPSSVSSTIQGSFQLGPLQFAVVSFRVDRAGTLASRVDWGNPNNDIDTAIIRGRCTVDQLIAEAAGCNEAAAVVTDEGLAKPSVVSPSVSVGDHTLIILNWGPGLDTPSYRLEGNVSSASAVTTSSLVPTTPSAPTPGAPSGPRRTDTVSFTLPAGSRSGVLTGPVRVANGVLDVKLDFTGNYIILACVGTSASCQPMGGRPQTRSYSIPAEFPAGPIQATVYFNMNFPQPAGDAKGTVTYTYTPQ